MQQLRSLQEAHLDNAWLTVGAFDGVHLGHQKILRELTAGAHAVGAPAVVLTFRPHPIEVLKAPPTSFYLSSLEEQAQLMSGLGVDMLITHPFTTETANTSAAGFVAELKGHLGLTNLWVGHDFALGHNREGNFERLQQLGQELGYQVHPVGALVKDGEVISSSRIRRLLAEGDVEEAARLLGRPYALADAVTGGAKRGRSIGIPTANLQIDPKRALPASGVYVTWASLGARRWGAVTNVGVRPTFEDGTLAPIVETHMLDYDGGDFYDQTLRLDFLAHLRPEQRFSGVEELVAQIHRDIQAARLVLAERSEAWWSDDPS